MCVRISKKRECDSDVGSSAKIYRGEPDFIDWEPKDWLALTFPEVQRSVSAKTYGAKKHSALRNERDMSVQDQEPKGQMATCRPKKIVGPT